jgi:hypothetical protein
VSVQGAQTTHSLLKSADLARDATSYRNNVGVDGLHRVLLLEVASGYVAVILYGSNTVYPVGLEEKRYQ